MKGKFAKAPTGKTEDLSDEENDDSGENKE
jgi:hypothetical protein